jgi:predicted transcriptional regulator YheO
MKIETRGSNPSLERHYPFVEGVVRLFFPYVEGAVHDLRKGTIIALFNNFSKRQVGDRSPLKELGMKVREFPDVFEPYFKVNWDGKRLKCTSITVRDAVGTPIGLICLNFDISSFDRIGRVLHDLQTVSGVSGNPVDLFDDAWEGKVDDFVRGHLKERGLESKDMSSTEKQELVKALYRKGYFNYKYAVRLVSRMLGVSRATIYNYLKQDG